MRTSASYYCLCHINFAKSVGRRIYWATTVNWRQVWIWFEGNFKGFRVQIEIPATIFDWISNQQLNLSLFLSDWYCQKLGLPNLHGRDEKVLLEKKMICKIGNKDHCSPFPVIFETISKFAIAFVRLISGKVGVDGFTRPRREIDIRYEFDWKAILKSLGCQQRFLQPF